MSDYTRLEEKIDSDPDEVVRESIKLLDANPDDAMALFLIATVYCRAEKFGFAANLFKRICELKPERSEPLNNLGMCYSGMGQYDKAQGIYLKAWGKKHAAVYAGNIAFTYMEQRKHEKAFEWAERALKLDPTCSTAISTRGFSKLATGQWDTAWVDWGATVGGKFRKRLQFKNEPQWDGTRGVHLVVYGEQGLGDEIMYASCIPDAARDNTVILECDKRLEGLFRRSFPGVSVYGTRRQTGVAWPAAHQIDAGLPIGQLPQFYRPSPSSCPGAPYIKADPERRLQWRSLFDSWGSKPKIGIAWTGGSKHNNPKARTAGVEAFRPLIESLDAHYISLQYKDPTAEIEASGLPVKHYRRACESDDYDDCAALVAELDMVIAVPTTVIHLAGAMGVETHCLTHPEADWNFQVGLPWYESVKLFKKAEGETWEKCIGRFAQGVHRNGPKTASRVYGAAALDRPALLSACGYHPVDPEPTADQAAWPDGVHLLPVPGAVAVRLQREGAVSGR